MVHIPGPTDLAEQIQNLCKQADSRTPATGHLPPISLPVPGGLSEPQFRQIQSRPLPGRYAPYHVSFDGAKQLLEVWPMLAKLIV